MRTITTTLMMALLAVTAAGAQPGSTTRELARTSRQQRIDRRAGEATIETTTPPEPWAQGDPADSLYAAARAALRRSNWRGAADLFRQVAERYPRSAYVSESLYWRAFALRNTGGSDDLRTALDVLKALEKRDPKYASSGDAPALKTQICGALAREGDAPCAAEIMSNAKGNQDASSSGRSGQSQQSTTCPSREDMEERVMAINALQNMNRERALPIIKKVLERRDACTAPLRRKAVMIASQIGESEAADILMQTAQNDPDHETREQAVFWMSQVDDPRTIDALTSILRGSADEDLKDKAIQALAQKDEGRAQQALRDFAERESEPADIRGKAVFWLGQSSSRENTTFLRSLFTKTKDDDLKRKIMFSLSQQDHADNDKWLLGIVENTQQPIDLRKHALNQIGQMDEISIENLLGLYPRLTEHDLKEQFMFVLSQRSERAAVDKLMDVAKNEKDRSIRQKAIFWLGQSSDPRVAKFLEDLIARP